MSPMSPLPDLQLSIRREFDLPRERVFELWTRPEHIARWFLPEGYSDPQMKVELREGGSYSFGITPPEGKPFAAVGKFLEIDAPERIVHTWSWEGEEMGPLGEMPDTTVTIVFEDLGGRTAMTLTHGGFESDDLRDKHEEGWGSCIGRFERLASAA